MCRTWIRLPSLPFLFSFVVMFQGCAGIETRTALERVAALHYAPDGTIDWETSSTQEEELIAMSGGQIVLGADGKPDASQSRPTVYVWRKSKPSKDAATAFMEYAQQESRRFDKAMDTIAILAPYASQYAASRPPATQPSAQSEPAWSIMLDRIINRLTAGGPSG